MEKHATLDQIVASLADLWALIYVLENPRHLQECAADGCVVVHTPTLAHPRYCSPACKES